MKRTDDRPVMVDCLFAVIGQDPQPMTLPIPLGLYLRMLPLEPSRNPQARRAA